MKYEICKGTKNGEDIFWTAIAWTDTLSFAEEVVYALRMASEDEFAILCNGEVIKM